MKTLEDKVAVVTGGGTGIGKAIASKLVALGATVVVTGRREAVLQTAVQDLGSDASYIVNDAAADGATKALAEAVIDRHGRIDIVVNNAGQGLSGPLVEATDEDIDGNFAVNATAPLKLARDVLPHLIASKGALLFVSSALTNGAAPGTSVYAAAKAAIDRATRVLAAEYGSAGVRVNALAPGYTETDMTEGMREDPATHNQFVAMTPMGRIGEPRDIADAAALLLQPDAAWVTGQVVQASGGLLI